LVAHRLADARLHLPLQHFGLVLAAVVLFFVDHDPQRRGVEFGLRRRWPGSLVALRLFLDELLFRLRAFLEHSLLVGVFGSALCCCAMLRFPF
jgi:hypothetical protein